MKNIVDVFKILGEETRFKIFACLLESELCVCELEDILRMEQSRISHNLKLLKSSGLINSKRDGKWIIYFVDSKIRQDPLIAVLRSEHKLSISFQKNIDRCKCKSARSKC